MQPKKFTRTKEDFACEKCGFFVKGSGYTNHCPECFWSKHVDINPGDRQASCEGLMKPIELTAKGGEYRVTHRCVRCGFERPNKISSSDNFATAINLSRQRNI